MNTKNLKFFFLLIFIAIRLDAIAQWGAPFTNSWISYEQPYVKISITQKGLHKVPFASLPAGFSVSEPEKFQIWHKGKQISILSTTNNEIAFYAIPNDGSSDSLLYRPMSSRINPYFSMYSDVGAYFLTIGSTNGLRAKTQITQINNSIPTLQYHNEKVTTAFKENYSLSTQSSVRPNFFNSFLELGASGTGVVQLVGVLKSYSFTLLNSVNIDTQKPFIDLLLHGRSNNSRNIDVYVGPNEKSLRLVQSIPNNGFEGTKFRFELQKGDVDDTGKGVVSLKSVNNERLERFSLSYFSVVYPQLFNMQGQNSKEFELVAGNSSLSRINISSTPENVKIVDISDSDQPEIIGGVAENLMIPRKLGRVLKLLVSNETLTVPIEKISLVKFSSYDPKAANYIILTSENLLNGANEYANYRSSKPGGQFKSLVVEIKDIYNQFNYGEPSPVAIKRFMDYMLSLGGTDKYLFLIGKSITHYERMVRELPGEVPTIGYPASDLLLVEGIAGSIKDIPAIPVGRLSALTNEQITNYLQKVRDYEQNSSGEFGWKKNVLHLNGGKTASEISQLKSLMEELDPVVIDGVIGGKVTPFVKQQAIAEVESVDITPEVNSGVGLISYFGHGSPTVTDLDMGYVTDASRGYSNNLKYPMMYFNGCGVGNIFSARFNPSPTASDRITLSLDWLLAANRGSVAIIANSFESFVSPASRYLQQLYQNMFVDSTTVNLPIGSIQIAVAKDIVTKSGDLYNIGNVHQSLLQGDPALRLVTVDKPDYSVDPDESILIYSESSSKSIQNSDSIRVAITVANQGRYVKNEKIAVKVSYLYTGGSVIQTVFMNSFAYRDTLWLSFLNMHNIQRIEVQLDPEHLLLELNTRNNFAELEVDWDVAKNEKMYPLVSVKDVVSPLLSVKFNEIVIKNDDKIKPNPKISFLIEDDRQLFSDTTLLDVYIKACGDDLCDFNKIMFSAADIRLDSISSRSFQLNYFPKDLVPGIYELLANVKDRAGNSGIQSYRIRFQIVDEGSVVFEVICSPNPAVNYARFETISEGINEISGIQYIIYNQLGTVIENKEIVATTYSDKLYEWYWLPKSATSGLYSYKVILKGKNGALIKSITGKLAIVN